MRHFILMLGMMIPATLWAQVGPAVDDKQTDLLGQGTLNVSLSGSGGFGRFSGATYRLTPRVSYFLKDGWSVSLEGRYENYTNANRYMGVGASTRYYFVRDRRLALFLQAGVTAGQSQFTALLRDSQGIYQGTGDVTTRAVQGNVGLGVQYRLSNRWAIEGNVEGTGTKRQLFSSPLYRSQLNFGLSFRLHK